MGWLQLLTLQFCKSWVFSERELIEVAKPHIISLQNSLASNKEIVMRAEMEAENFFKLIFNKKFNLHRSCGNFRNVRG